MLAASRAALKAAITALRGQLATGVHGQQLGDELFGVTAVLDKSASLRRALTDPSRDGADRAELARRVFGGKVSDPAVAVVAGAADLRWSDDRDLPDALEELGVRAVMSSAAYGQRADEVEEQLFRFERLVAANPQLRDALTDRTAAADRRTALVSRLLEGKVADETLQLARQAVAADRGRRFDRVIAQYLTISGQEREELTAVVTAAVPLDEGQIDRIKAALSRIYSRAIHLNVVVDPGVLGGIRVEVGDEVIDGTTVRKLDEARRKLTGS